MLFWQQDVSTKIALYIASMCEKAGLFQRTLEHYTDIMILSVPTPKPIYYLLNGTYCTSLVEQSLNVYKKCSTLT
jgi:hypothetical protein